MGEGGEEGVSFLRNGAAAREPRGYHMLKDKTTVGGDCPFIRGFLGSFKADGKAWYFLLC